MLGVRDRGKMVRFGYGVLQVFICWQLGPQGGNMISSRTINRWSLWGVGCYWGCALGKDYGNSHGIPQLVLSRGLL
jgi:hypothetical protein